MYFRQENPYFVLSISPTPEIIYPGNYFVINPSGNGLVVANYVNNKGKYLSTQKQVGKPYKSLCRSNRAIFNWLIIVETEGMSPERVLRLLIMLTREQYCTIGTIILFSTTDCGDTMFDPVVNFINLNDGKLSQVEIFEYWPDMPKLLFSNMTIHLHPNYTEEEIEADSRSETEKAIAKIEEGDFLGARPHIISAYYLLENIGRQDIAKLQKGKLLEETEEFIKKALESFDDNFPETAQHHLGWAMSMIDEWYYRRGGKEETILEQ